jgi:hypothetical protein
MGFARENGGQNKPEIGVFIPDFAGKRKPKRLVVRFGSHSRRLILCGIIGSPLVDWQG